MLKGRSKLLLIRCTNNVLLLPLPLPLLLLLPLPALRLLPLPPLPLPPWPLVLALIGPTQICT